MISKIIKIKNKAADKYRLYNAKKVADKKVADLADGMTEIEPEYAQRVKQYWDQYGEKVNLKWWKFYSEKYGQEDVRFIPDDIFYQKIVYQYGRHEFEKAFEDKAYHDILFSDLRRPKTCFRNINGVLLDEHYNKMTEEEAVAAAQQRDAVIIKPTVETGAGKNVYLIKFGGGAAA